MNDDNMNGVFFMIVVWKFTTNFGILAVITASLYQHFQSDKIMQFLEILHAFDKKVGKLIK